MALDVPAHLFTQIDHVGIAVPDLDEAIAFYRDTFGMESVHEEANEEQGVREAMLAVGDSGTLHPAARPAQRELHDREVPRPQRPGHPAAGLPGRRHRRGLRDPARARPAPALRRRRGAAPPTRGSTSSTPRTPAACWSSWSSLPLAAEPDLVRRQSHQSAHPGRTPLGCDAHRPRPLETTVQEILDAILAGETAREDFAALALPETYRGRHRRTGTRSTCSRAWRARTRTRAGRCTSRTCPLPELGPGEALVAVMASAINYNTVWTSIFEPVLDLRLPRALRPGSARSAKRHDLPYHVVGSDLSGVVLAHRRRRAPVEARRRGRRALPVGRAREPRRPQRHDDGSRAADLGLRDQLRRPGRDRAGEVQPADAQARPPDLGGGRLARAGELHGVPPAGQPATAPG